MDFNTACEKAKAFTKRPSDQEFLEFYGLFKQSTVGDVNVERPGALDLKGKAKWDSWNQHKGLSKEEAQKAYIATYEKYAPKYA
ncbi:acyl-CoA-binding protein homolog [Zeugodacus cucurbitae]|uniref:acyl-CoA-binding protein homolog n=1 Tax=Zeugodacus cucurbitae TaxID=28588 RepID=UPI00059681A1|nr:acyl-CoA-binding protein homolog [Zeugodacus cucurbitae]